MDALLALDIAVAPSAPAALLPAKRKHRASHGNGPGAQPSRGGEGRGEAIEGIGEGQGMAGDGCERWRGGESGADEMEGWRGAGGRGREGKEDKGRERELARACSSGESEAGKERGK